MAALSKYIPALDGLRAFAVIAVILYHLDATILPCGLLGVTVFFVLSGYLITGLLFKEWRETKAINLPQFWLRRVRRLVPAIIFLIVGVAALTTFLAPDLLTKLRNDIVAALLFFTNWWYIFQDVSYFEAMGAPSPVTHFWSLAIEEQFYIIWPPILLLLFSHHVKRRNIQRSILVVCAISVLLMAVLYNPTGDPSRVYYGTDTRAFSLLIGAWLAFEFPQERIMGYGRRGLDDHGRQVSGIAAIFALIGMIVMMMLINGYSSFLYYGGILLLSLLTAVLIVALVNPASIVARIFALRPFVWIGQRSYGIYLWHYPLLLLMNPRNYTGETPWYIYLVQIAVVFAVAAFSYRFIENPIRHGVLGRFFKRLANHELTLPSYIRDHVVQCASATALVVVAVVGILVVPATATQSNTGTTSVAIQGGSGDSTGSTADQGGSSGQSSAGSGSADVPASASAVDKANNANVLIIGDSVIAGIAGYDVFGEDNFPNATIDAAISRQLYTGKDYYQSYADDGWNGEAVVFELGTNGVATYSQVEDMLDAVPSDKPIFLINVRLGVDQQRTA